MPKSEGSWEPRIRILLPDPLPRAALDTTVYLIEMLSGFDHRPRSRYGSRVMFTGMVGHSYKK